MGKLILILMLALPMLCSAAERTANDSVTANAVEEINRIKLNPQEYLYAEATRKDWAEAYKVARAMLQENLTAWLMETQGEDVKGCIARSDEKFVEIRAKRGELYRAFVYLKKTDILPYTEPHTIIATTVPTQTVVPVSQSQQTESGTYQLTSLEQQMLQIVQSSDIQKFIKGYEENGVITSYGKYINRPTSGTYYLFIYDKSGGVPACLKVSGQNVMNLGKLTADSMDNYKGCGGIWFVTSERKYR